MRLGKSKRYLAADGLPRKQMDDHRHLLITGHLVIGRILFEINHHDVFLAKKRNFTVFILKRNIISVFGQKFGYQFSPVAKRRYGRYEKIAGHLCIVRKMNDGFFPDGFDFQFHDILLLLSDETFYASSSGSSLSSSAILAPSMSKDMALSKILRAGRALQALISNSPSTQVIIR